MKRLILVLGTFLIFYQCKNVEKLMDQGSYTEVIRHSVQKLQGKKKKAQYVRALEEAWARYSKEKEAHMLDLSNANHRQSWKEIIHISREVNELQNLIKPLTPLRADNGHRAKFNWLKTQEWRSRAVSRFLETSWEAYDEYIASGRKGNKRSAQEAYRILKEIEPFEDSPTLSNKINEATHLGTTYVLGKLVKHHNSNVRSYSIEMLKDLLNTRARKEQWTVLHYNKQAQVSYDFAYEMSFYSIYVSDDQTNTVIDRIHRDVKVGEEAVRDSKGKVVTDTSGNVIMQDVLERVYAEVITLNQFKEAIVEIEVRLVARGENQPVQTDKLSARADFTNAYQDWRGDRRAFEGNPTRGNPMPFPEDPALILECTEQLQRSAENLLFQWL